MEHIDNSAITTWFISISISYLVLVYLLTWWHFNLEPSISFILEFVMKTSLLIAWSPTYKSYWERLSFTHIFEHTLQFHTALHSIRQLKKFVLQLNITLEVRINKYAQGKMAQSKENSTPEVAECLHNKHFHVVALAIQGHFVQLSPTCVRISVLATEDGNKCCGLQFT